VVERILLERSDRFAEQTCADDQDDVGHYDEENRKRCVVLGSQYCFVLESTPGLTSTTGECVYYGATDEAAYNANDGGNWDGARRLAKRNTSNKNNSLHALTQKNDERKGEQCPLSYSSSSSSPCKHCIKIRARDLTLDLTLAIESMLKLDAPFSLRVVQLEHGDSHDKDHDSGDELEYSCASKLKETLDTTCC